MATGQLRMCTAAVAAAATLLTACGSGRPATAAKHGRTELQLDDTLKRLHMAAQTNNQRTVCELMVPWAERRQSAESAEVAVQRLTRTCAGRLGADQLKALANGTAAQQVGHATVNGNIATATIIGPHQAPGAGAEFIDVGGRWRLLVLGN
jgi:hypothetical protein